MDLWWFYFGVASIDCRCVVCVHVFVVLVLFRVVARVCFVFAATCFDFASVLCFVIGLLAIDRVVIDRCDPLRVVDRFGVVCFVDVTPGVAGYGVFLHDV